MSQNKTITPGMEPEMPARGFSQMGGGMSAPQNAYQRTQRQSNRGTHVSGMTDYASPLSSAGRTGDQEAVSTFQPRRVVSSSSGKPVVGFLYSISRTMAGEFWPLHRGQNVIGQNPENDIQLPEGTVSGEHAVIVVRRLKNPEKVIASISDTRSTNGTMLNGESLGFAAVDCKNGDIITIGDNYELYLVLIDPTALGLKVSEKFVEVEVEDYVNDENVPPVMQTAHQRPTRTGGVDIDPGIPTPDTKPYSSNGYVPSNGTVGLDGSVSSYSDMGGTVGY